ncbi:MAG: hypothetical protein IJA32_00170 [Lachnospiraceae bacterium]|nr:hypothetical protein [Lachnospiraceae bacterium]
MQDSEKLDLILSEIGVMKSEISGIKSEMSDMKSEMSGIKSEVNVMKSEMSDMKSEMSDMKSENSSMKSEISSLRSHIENVTDKNIQTIAEGHLDLSRKLDEVLKVENEKELLIIRVRIIEDEIRLIKEKLEKIA